MGADERISSFDVAIWQHWPPLCDELPLVGVVAAPDAAEAVTAVMRAYGLTEAGHVAAREMGRRFMHRANEVRIWEERAFVRRAGNGEL